MKKKNVNKFKQISLRSIESLLMTILESNCILLEPKNLRIIRYYSEYPLATDFQYWVSHK